MPCFVCGVSQFACHTHRLLLSEAPLPRLLTQGLPTTLTVSAFASSVPLSSPGKALRSTVSATPASAFVSSCPHHHHCAQIDQPQSTVPTKYVCDSRCRSTATSSPYTRLLRQSQSLRHDCATDRRGAVTRLAPSRGPEAKMGCSAVVRMMRPPTCRLRIGRNGS